MRLGWRNPRPNDFQGPDLKPLRDLFGNLQQFMTWPHVRLGVTSNFNVAGGGGIVTVAWTAELDDPYQLHVPNATAIMVPRDFDSWMAVGVAQAATTFGGGAGQRRLEWRLNAAVLPWQDAAHFSAVGVRLNAAIVHPVKKGDVLDVQVANQSPGIDGANAQATLFFLPLV